MLVLPSKFPLILLFSTREVSIHEPFIWDAEVVAVVWKRSEDLIRGRGLLSPSSSRDFAPSLPLSAVFRLSVRPWAQGLWRVRAWVLTCSISAAPPPSVTFFLHPSSPLPFCLFPYFSFQQDEDYWVRKIFFKWFNKTLCIILKVNLEFA